MFNCRDVPEETREIVEDICFIGASSTIQSYKYVDDSTLSEALQRQCCSSSSDMTHFFTNLLDWIARNDMQLNLSKTKEMILGPLAKSIIPPLTATLGTIDRVTSFKLLGVTIDSSLCWSTHINNMIKKATTRLYFFKQLKRAGLSTDQLFLYYKTVMYSNTAFLSGIMP